MRSQARADGADDATKPSRLAEALKRSPVLRPAVRAVFAITLVLVLYSAFSPSGTHPSLFPCDKAEHFAAFYVLALLAAAAVPRAPLLWIGLALSLLGGGIELVQALPLVQRDADFFDWVADTAAIACAYAPVSLPWWRSLLRRP